MRKQAIYIILFVIAAAVAVLVIVSNNKKEKVFDERITLRQRDKIPYGSKIAYESLPYIFPTATISVNKDEPGYWDSLSSYSDKQALIIISPQFWASEFELNKMLRFVENGNDVFISTRMLSDDAHDIFKIESSAINTTTMEDWDGKKMIDRLYLNLVNPPFGEKKRFTYDGQKFNSWILNYDSSVTDVLGTDELDRTNFIHLKAGKGNFYIHLAPLAFSNYFLLHRDNMLYYENALSVISPDVKTVVWDEYYLNKRYYYESPQSENDNKGWMNVLFEYPGLKWALLIAILGLLLFVLMEMRRKQRYIPVVSKPKNESLDFVKTIGRLYYDKGDHVNLSKKMAAYFLEHVRNRYKLSTSILDEEFIKKLQFKTGYEEAEIRNIVSFIQKLSSTSSISEKQLADFHKKLESFYQSNN
ncbi:MAG TPA: DUF4350 domain-containing protein [Chitinophagaceae bacterium]